MSEGAKRIAAERERQIRNARARAVRRKSSRECAALFNAKDERRYWAKIDKNGSVPGHVIGLDACWNWTAFRKPNNGYGTFHIGGRSGAIVLAHRLSYQIHFGPVPDDLSVLHRCDNPACCNPGHLFLGTQQDNVDDREAKGRGVHPPGRW